MHNRKTIVADDYSKKQVFSSITDFDMKTELHVYVAVCRSYTHSTDNAKVM